MTAANTDENQSSECPAKGPKEPKVIEHAVTEAEDKEPAPLLMLVLCLICALEGADTMLLRSVLFALQADQGLSLKDVATMTLFQALSQALAAPVWGVIADRRILKRKTILTIGAVLQGSVTGLVGVSSGLLPMIFLRSLSGAMLASLRPVSNGIVADVTSDNHRGKVFGWIQFAMHVGMIIGSVGCAPLSTRTIGGVQGWRVAFAAVGAFAVSVGIFVAVFMQEPPREEAAKQEGRGAVVQEIKRLFGYLKTPTFCTLVVQGCFGCVPWNALGYQILFYQLSGLGDFQASLLQAFNLVAGATGALMGGMIGDCAARKSRYHGRPAVAQFSILAGVPFVWLIFMVPPPAGAIFWYYLAMVVLLGLTTTWCPTGVNWPMLSEVVDPNGRSAILAWQTALEGAFAAVFGNAAVGFLANDVFGYDLSSARSAEGSAANMQALGKSLAWCTSLPWLLCFIIASFLHWGYPRDLQRLERQREAKRQQRLQDQQAARDLEAADASPKEKAGCEAESRPRLMSLAANATSANRPAEGEMVEPTRA